MKFWYTFVILTLFFSCDKVNDIDGNYSVCNNGKYLEVYFRNDSIRVASKDDWIGLSEWRTIKMKNDTLYFDSFGEWKETYTAKINFKSDKTELYIIQTDTRANLHPINETVSFENEQKFWEKFKSRMASRACD